MSASVLLLPGDGVGPEVVTQARAALEAMAPALGGLEIIEGDFGGVAVDRHGDPLLETTLAQAREASATLLGAVGGPQYDGLPAQQRPEAGLLRLRRELAVHANLRPITAYPDLAGRSSLRDANVAGLDLVIVRELIGGLYFGEPRGITGTGDDREGHNTMRYSVAEIRRIARVAFDLAAKRRGKLCSVDKANVLETSRLWREVVDDMAGGWPSVAVSHVYVDNAAMQLVRRPADFDVILTENLFGDILSDLGAELVGSIGMLPSASLGEGTGLYEPVHGSAPDIAGQDKANPCAAFLSVAMMLESSLDQPRLAGVLRDAVTATLAAGMRTADLCREGEAAVSCSAMGAAVVERLSAGLAGQQA